MVELNQSSKICVGQHSRLITVEQIGSSEKSCRKFELIAVLSRKQVRYICSLLQYQLNTIAAMLFPTAEGSADNSSTRHTVQQVCSWIATMSSRCVHSSPLSSACMNAHVTHRSTHPPRICLSVFGRVLFFDFILYIH